MLRLGHLLGVAAYVSPSCIPARAWEAVTAVACPDAGPAGHTETCEAQLVFDSVDTVDTSADEEALLLELLQVSTKLERGGESQGHPAAARGARGPGSEHQSFFGSLLNGNVGKTSFVLAVVLPHVAAFLVSYCLRCHPLKPANHPVEVEALQEEDQMEPPRRRTVLL